MDKIILVQPENGLNEATYAPLGLLSLASYVRDEFKPEIVDLRFSTEEKLLDKVSKDKPLAIGFSMLTGSCILQVLRITEKIKSNNFNIKIIVGGIHPTFFPDQTLSHPLIDFVVMNEGERTLLYLLRALKKNQSFFDIPNLGWKNEGKNILNKRDDCFLDMENLPMPAWDLINVEQYIKHLSHNPGERVIDFYTSKGCPFPCSFCYNLFFNNKKWRAKSAKKAFEELKFLHDKYKVNYFIIHDDNFVVDRNRALEFADLINKSGIDIKYSVDSRVDYFNHSFLEKMKKSGLCELRVGCESGSNRVLKDVIQKGITAEQTVKAVEIARELDLKLMLSFVIGWPTETEEERQETIDLILKLQKIHKKASIYPLWIYIPYPGTILFERAVQMGFEPPKTLEKWGSYFWGKAYLPWIKNRKEYEVIHELSPFAWYNKSFLSLPNKSLKNSIRHFIIKTFRILILFRFKNNFWKFPIEARLIAWMKKFFQLSAKKYDKFLSGTNYQNKLNSFNE